MFPRLLVQKVEKWDGALSEEEQEAITALHDMLGNPAAVSLFSLKKVVQHISRLMLKEKAKALFTDYVRETIEALALLLDLLERVDKAMVASHDFGALETQNAN